MTRRLFFALAGLAVVVLVLAGVLGRDQVVIAERRGAVIDLERAAFKLALAAQDDLEHAPHPSQTRLIRRDARRIAAASGAIAVVTDRTGTVVTVAPGRARPRAATLIDREAALVLRRTTTASHTVRLAGTDYEVAEVPIMANEGTVGVVLLAQRSSVLSAAAHDRLSLFTPTLLIAVVLSIVLAWLLARALTRPLAQLVAATRRVAREGAAAPSVEPQGPAELRELADAFNAMSIRVRELIDRQSQFASDVSHQLRTPLTTMGLALERVREHGRAGEHDEASDSLWAVHVEVDRLQRLIEGLLLLTRVPLQDAAREPVDVAAVARERASVWQSLARERRVELTVRAPARADALAVAGAVDQILDNLIDNALEVAPADSELAIDVEVTGRDLDVAVTDAGPGLSDDARVRAFDRFWRGEGARGDGIGIGLTIVRDLAHACRGEIELLPAEGGGTRAVLTLESAPRGAFETNGAGATAGATAMALRLRTRLTGYLRARDPERAAALESEVWHACALDGTEIDGCDECATTVFSLAHERVPSLPAGDPRDQDELDAHLLRTIGGLDTEQIAQVLEVTPRTVVRLERRAQRTLIPVVDERLAPVPAPPRRRVPRAARVGGIAAVAVVVATGTAAATGSLPDPVQHQVARVLRSVGVRVPDPEPDRPVGTTRTRPVRPDGPAASNVAVFTVVRPDGVLAEPVPAPTPTTPTTGSVPTSGRGTAGGTVVPPGQAKKPGDTATTPPGQTKQSGGTFVPPGQAKQSGDTTLPPGQAKKAGDTATVPPGQAKKAGDSATVPPGQAKKAGDSAMVPPGQAKKAAGG